MRFSFSCSPWRTLALAVGRWYSVPDVVPSWDSGLRQSSWAFHLFSSPPYGSVTPSRAPKELAAWFALIGATARPSKHGGIEIKASTVAGLQQPNYSQTVRFSLRTHNDLIHAMGSYQRLIPETGSVWELTP